jgi:hypothetical protein
MTEVGLKGQMLLSDIQRMFYHDADARVLNVIIQTLESMKFIWTVETEKGTLIKHHSLKKGNAKEESK